MFRTVKIATTRQFDIKELKPMQVFERFFKPEDESGNWLDNLAEWWLRKRCYIINHTVNDWVYTSKAEEVEIDLNNIRNSVYEQMQYLYGRYGVQPNTLFVGQEINHAIRLRINSDMIYRGSRDEMMHWMGMQIIVVPWMKGMLLWNDDYAR